MRVPIEISLGEAADRLSILYVKRDELKDPAKLAFVIREIDLLEVAIRSQLGTNLPSSRFAEQFETLLRLNRAMWPVPISLTRSVPVIMKCITADISSNRNCRTGQMASCCAAGWPRSGVAQNSLGSEISNPAIQ